MQRKRRSPKSLDLNEEMRTIVIGTSYVNNILVEKNIIRCMKWCQILHALYLLLLGLEGEECVEQADYEVRMLAKHPFEGEVCLWVEITFCHDNPYILCKDNANRVQNQQACLVVLPRCSLSCAKIMQIECKINKLAWLFCRDAAYLVQR